MLELEGVSVRFGGLVAVDSLGFGVREGSIHGLIGPNGAGKSTVVNCIYGFVMQDEGSIYLRGETLV